MSSTKDFDPAMALAERSRQRGDVVFAQLSDRGRAYPECGRPIWMENTVMGLCDAVAPWSVLLPGVQVGRGVRLNRVVVDRGCEIPDGMSIGEDAELDDKRFYRSENGVTLVTREMLDRVSAGA